MVGRKIIDLIVLGAFLLFSPALTGCGTQQAVPQIPDVELLEGMYNSIRLKDVERFKSHWKNHEKLDFRSVGYELPLVYAARAGSADILDFLLGKSAHSEVDLDSALLASVTQPDVGTVATLVRHVSDTQPTEKYDQLLYYAIEAGMTPVGEFLLSVGASLSYVHKGSNTLLHAAATSGETAFVEVLIQAGVDPSIRNSENLTALEVAQEIWGKTSQVAQALKGF